jgi:hypothetical protein
MTPLHHKSSSFSSRFMPLTTRPTRIQFQHTCNAEEAWHSGTKPEAPALLGIVGREPRTMPRFIFRNDALKLLAFTLHETGANLPELHPLHPWRRLEQADDLRFIYDWSAAQFRTLARELATTGYCVFAADRVCRGWKVVDGARRTAKVRGRSYEPTGAMSTSTDMACRPPPSSTPLTGLTSSKSRP